MGTHQRWLIKGLKVWADIVFFIAAGILILLPLIGIITSLPGVRGEDWTVSVPVAIGEGLLRPILPLPPGHDAAGGLSEVRVVDAGGELRVNSQKPGLFLSSMTYYWLALLVAVWILLLLRRILRRTLAGEPFSPENVRALILIGWTTVAVGAVGPIFEFLLSRWVLRQVEVSGIPLSPPFDLRMEVVIYGLFILLLAGVWREAVLMAEDQALTV